MSAAPLPPFDEIYIDLKMNKEVSSQRLSMVITRELKQCQQGFNNAETLYGYLINDIKERKARNDYYLGNDIRAFRYAITALVRYAPSSDKAMYYFNHTLREFQQEALVTCKLEVILMANLLFVLNKYNRMEEALEILKTALEIGVFYAKYPKNRYNDNQGLGGFDDPLHAFEHEAIKIMTHFNLEFNDDKTEVRPSSKKN